MTLLPALIVSLLAQDAAPAARPLFNGRDLTGWVPVNVAPSTFSVTPEGHLHCSGRPTGELRTERMYQNFELEVEWRHLVPKGNAGIFVWADDLTAPGVPFHRSIEVQVLENAYGNTRGYTTHGDVFPIHGATMVPVNGRGGMRAFPTSERSKPAPEWNHYRVTCVDGDITLAVNGEVVTRGTQCSLRKGYVCLESEGGVVDYRNLTIRELPATPVAPEHVAVADRGYRTLYTGVDLSGWRVPDAAREAWQVRDWVLAFTGHPAPGTDADVALATARAFAPPAEAGAGLGFLVDVELTEASGAPRLVVLGQDVRLDRADPALAGHLSLGWNRIELAFTPGRLDVSVNGHALPARAVAADAAAGPLQIAPEGPVGLANLFVRPRE